MKPSSIKFLGRAAAIALLCLPAAGNAATPLTGLPNFAPFTPPGWTGSLVLTKQSGSTTDATSFVVADDIFLDWCFINDGPADATARTYFYLFVDGGMREYFYFDPPLESGHYFYWRNIEIGSLGMGSHTFEMVADATDAITESDESDNTSTRTILINLYSRNAAGLSTPTLAQTRGR